MEMVHAFNSLAQLVPTEVLVEEHLHQRAEVISAYIKVCTCTVYTGSDLVGCVKSESVNNYIIFMHYNTLSAPIWLRCRVFVNTSVGAIVHNDMYIIAKR